MTLVRKVNGVNSNITRVVRVENSVVSEIGSIVQVDSGVLTTRFSSGATDFIIGDAGIDFEVTRPGLVILSITTGTLKGTNYDDGDLLGPVDPAETRTLTGSVTVPNDAMWLNAGEDITITDISFEQPGPPPPLDRNRYSETFYDNFNPFTTNVSSSAPSEDCTTNDDYYIREKTCETITTTSGYTPRYTLTCVAPDGCDQPNGTVIQKDVVITSESSAVSCGDCEDTASKNPDYTPTFTLTEVAPGLRATINPDTGKVEVVSIDGYTVELASGQQASYTPLPYGYTNTDGEGFEIRDISVQVSGTIPDDTNNYKDAGEEFGGEDFATTIGAKQNPKALEPPVVSASIMYSNNAFSFITVVPTNGSTVSITDFPTGGQYLVIGSSTNSGTITYDPDDRFNSGSLLGRKHTLTATNALGADESDTITFTVRTNTI